jgi:glutathione S-transferase
MLALDFPNLPYLIDGDVQITESSSIMRFIVNQNGAGKDFGGKNDSDKAHADMIFGVLSNIKGAATRHCYGSGDKNAAIEISNRMEAVQKFIGDKKFIVGD